MEHKRSATAARKRPKPIARWGRYILAGALLAVLVASGISAQLFATSDTPHGSSMEDADPTLYAHGDRLRPLVEATAGAQTLNIYGPGGQIIAQVARNGLGGSQKAPHLLADHLGSTRAILDADDNVVAHFEYGPHGETATSGVAAAEARYRYTGHPWDESQGLYQTPNRGYDPATGRFLSVDPQRQDASPYVYAGSSPVGYIDPTGDIWLPFFVVTEDMASTEQQQTEAILKLFGRPLQGTAAGMITPTDLAGVETSGSNLADLPNARKLLTEGGRSINRGRGFIFVTEQTTPDAVRNITEGMQRLRHLSQVGGEPAGSQFEDITIISRHANKRMGRSLFESLDASGFPRVRMFLQSFHVLAPSTNSPNAEVYSVVVRGTFRPEPRTPGLLKEYDESMPPDLYLQRMEANVLPELARRSHRYVPGTRSPLQPQLENSPPLLPPTQLQPQIEPRIELVIPRGDQPVLPSFPDVS